MPPLAPTTHRRSRRHRQVPTAPMRRSKRARRSSPSETHDPCPQSPRGPWQAPRRPISTRPVRPRARAPLQISLRWRIDEPLGPSGMNMRRSEAIHRPTPSLEWKTSADARTLALARTKRMPSFTSGRAGRVWRFHGRSTREEGDQPHRGARRERRGTGAQGPVGGADRRRDERRIDGCSATLPPASKAPTSGFHAFPTAHLDRHLRSASRVGMRPAQ